MSHPVPTQAKSADGLRSSRQFSFGVAAAGIGVGAAIFCGSLVLWFHYGTAVFFEMIASGISACF